METYQCPHCGDVFDAEMFDAHLVSVAHNATTAQVARWLHQWATERKE